MFDKLVIAIGVNRAKKGWMPIEERLERLRALYADEPRVEVVTYETLTMDLAKEYGAKYIVRGVRSVTDFEYERTIAAIDPTVEVMGAACPLFVPLVENGRFSVGDKVVEQIAEEYLAPLREAGVDTLIMGCTHYTLLTEVVGKIMGPGVELINAGAESAWELKRTLTANDALAPERAGSYQLYASDITGDFATLAGRFLNEEVPPVEGVDIDLY